MHKCIHKEYLPKKDHGYAVLLAVPHTARCILNKFYRSQEDEVKHISVVKYIKMYAILFI